MNTALSLAERCRERVRELSRASPSAHPHPHAGAQLADHQLTTAALVACLVSDPTLRDQMRLAALYHDEPGAKEALAATPDAQHWLGLLEGEGAALDRGEAPALSSDEHERLLAQAHLAASRRLPVQRAVDFGTHPLADAPLVDLVYGGATKIKQYVFESARLPEIRGASALLDHINRLDLPALWGVVPEQARQHERYHEARAWYAALGQGAALDAPECVLYASGGNILALAPAGRGAGLAEAIERRYAEVTQVAASVAVAESFSLLELQYGRQPQIFWRDHFANATSQNDKRQLMLTSYGMDTPAFAAALGQFDQQDLRAALIRRYGTKPPKPFLALFGMKEDAVEATILQADTQRIIDMFVYWFANEPVSEPFQSIFETLSLNWVFGSDTSQTNSAQTSAAEINARKGFGELVTLLATAANSRRSGPARSLPFVELASQARRCSSCDIRPAGYHRENPAQDLCAACLRKREAGLTAKKGALKQTLGWLQSWGSWLEATASVEVAGTVDDLQELGGLSRTSAAENYVGLIYADGNSVGAHVAGLASIAAYRRFASQMQQANEQAVAQALARYCQPSKPNDTWPFEIITIGGDDVLLFVGADVALEVAAAIAQDFGAAMQGTGISLSAGVLIMPMHTPVRFARDLVEQLLKSAKRTSKDAKVGATIDFMALKAVTMLSETIGDYREIAHDRGGAPLRNGARAPKLRLTQRPYTLDQLGHLIGAARALSEAHFPRSQLYQLREFVEAGEQLPAIVDYRYFVERGKQRRDGGAAYRALDEQLARLCAGDGWLPWRGLPPDKPASYDTPLLDLIEIAPFLSAPDRVPTEASE